MAAAVEALNLHKTFEGVTALNKVSFAVPQGALYGLIGADGAGKTTLMRILVTLLRPDKGTARVLGKDSATDYAAIRGLVGYMPQRFSLYQDLSVRENMLFFADVFGVRPAERQTRMRQLLSFSRLDEFQNRRAANLSGGMKQKLALSCALIHTPALLFLDEPTTGVDPVSRKEFWDILFDLKRQGITFFVSTPYMDEAVACDSLLFLHKGEVLREGSPQKLLSEYQHTLYKITGAAGGIMVPQNTPLPKGIVLMYPSAGALHAALHDPAVSPADVLSRVKTVAPSADAIERTMPSVEDLLFLLLSQKEAA
jgi:ABC-2 type transport system ATP-binding protein